MDEIIVVTGATGWIGRNFLHQLQLKYKSSIFNKKVIGFASKRTIIKSTGYSNSINIIIYPLKEINEHIKGNSKILFIHTAFLTREKIKNIGLNNYIKINNEITYFMRDIIKQYSNSKIVLISSGAVTEIENKTITKENITINPYSYLKYNEENILTENRKALILRVYGLTGRFIRDPNIFALGNFLLSAKNKSAITLNSKIRVIRSYAIASDIASLAINWIMNEADVISKCILTSSFKIDLLELANVISNIYNLPPVQYNYDKDKLFIENNYSCETKQFTDFLKSYNMKPMSIKDQLTDTFSDL